jgi:hypothetical protein
MNPWQFLKTWWQTHSLASRLSLGVVGSAATIAVVFSFAKGDPQRAGLFLVGGFSSIVVMSLVEKAIRGKGLLGILISTVIALVFLGTIVLLFTSFFFDRPLHLRPPDFHPEFDSRSGVSLATLQMWLRDADGGEAADRLARAMGRDAQQLATDYFPITGDIGSSKNIKLTKIDQLFLQSTSAVLKLQMFPLAPGARQVRGLSLRRFDEGTNFVADSWAFVLRNKELIPCEQIGLDNFTGWQIPPIVMVKPKEPAPTFLLIAVYPNIHFFVNHADSVTIALEDIAGTIDSVNLTVAGFFKDFRFTRCFEFGRELRFVEVPESRMIRQKRQIKHILNPFYDVLNNFKTNYFDLIASEGERRRAQVVINVWKDCSASTIDCDAVTIQHVTRNLEMFVSGTFTP